MIVYWLVTLAQFSGGCSFQKKKGIDMHAGALHQAVDVLTRYCRAYRVNVACLYARSVFVPFWHDKSLNT